MSSAGTAGGVAKIATRRKRRDLRRSRRRIHASESVFRFLRMTFGPVMNWLFRLHAHNTEVFRRVKPPFVILANHACVLDPFLLASRVPYAVHYVVSDSNFRSPIVDVGLRLVGGIPKTKALSDLETVKRIVQIKARKGIIGIFPEGQSTWDGHSLPIYYSTAKLLKALKVPVVTTRIQGSFLSLPRWGRAPRRGRIDMHYTLALTPKQMRGMTVAEIYEQIVAHLDNDEFEAQKERRILYTSRRRAEYLEIVLFICPDCRHIATLRSRGNTIACENCGYAARMNGYGYFEPVSGPLHFQNLRRWNLWQVQHFEGVIDDAVATGRKDPILTDGNAKVREGFKSQPLEFRGIGTLSLYLDRLTLDTTDGRGDSLTFEVDEIEGINVQNSEFLEFYYRGSLYQVKLLNRGGNSYKWNLAVRHLQGRAKETLKREPSSI